MVIKMYYALYIARVLAVVLSSSGFTGAVISFLLKRALKNAKDDAEKRRAARLEEEMLRYELDKATCSLLLALTRYARGMGGESELEAAETNYTLCVSRADLALKRHYLESGKRR